MQIVEAYLDSRIVRFPASAKRHSPAGGLATWPASAALLVGADGDRITRGTLQYRVLRAFRRAGIDGDCARATLVHGLRHTFATELANSDVSVYTLMNLLGTSRWRPRSATFRPQAPKPAKPPRKAGSTTC